MSGEGGGGKKRGKKGEKKHVGSSNIDILHISTRYHGHATRSPALNKKREEEKKKDHLYSSPLAPRASDQERGKKKKRRKEHPLLSPSSHLTRARPHVNLGQGKEKKKKKKKKRGEPPRSPAPIFSQRYATRVSSPDISQRGGKGEKKEEKKENDTLLSTLPFLNKNFADVTRKSGKEKKKKKRKNEGKRRRLSPSIPPGPRGRG